MQSVGLIIYKCKRFSANAHVPKAVRFCQRVHTCKEYWLVIKCSDRQVAALAVEVDSITLQGDILAFEITVLATST